MPRRRPPADPPTAPAGDAPRPDVETSEKDVPLPMIGPATSAYAEVQRVPVVEEDVAPRTVERGVVAFDLDGTLLDDIGLISHVAGEVLAEAFGTPPDEARIHYLATTGMPFEAQLAQLYPGAPVEQRAATARIFHQKKVKEAYAHATPFPEVPKLLKQLDRDKWTLVVSTGAERETADLLLEREGLRYWFEGVLGSGQGTKREHLAEFRRRYPGAPLFLVGDSRFDMEAARSVPEVVPLGRASSMHGWTLTPDDLRRWGAAWADYSLSALPSVLPELLEGPGAGPADRPRRRSSKSRR